MYICKLNDAQSEFECKGPNTRCNMLHAICCMQQNRSVCVRKVACCNCRSTVARNRTSFYSTRLVAPNIKGSSRRRCKKKMAAVWTVNKIEQFIDLYEQRPCLYNTKMKEYHDRDIRKKAMEEISGVLEVSGEYPMNAPLTSLQTLFGRKHLFLTNKATKTVAAIFFCLATI